VLFLQIRQAEVALADGRLDEAYELIHRSEALRTHRRGQALVSGLVEKLVDRARTHLDESRPSKALLDCEKAQKLGGNLPPILALRSEIEDQILTTDRQRREQARVGMIATAAQLVDSALGRRDVDRAVMELVRARGNGCNDQRLRQLDGNVREMLQSQVQAALDEGRLDQAGPLMDRLERLDAESLPTQQLARAVAQARKAWQAISRGDPDEAGEILHRLMVQLPRAKWINEALEHLDAAETSLRTVRTGPLGLLVMSELTPQHNTSVSSVPSTSQGQDARVTGESLPAKFLVQVDGAGTYLISRQPVTTVGPISSSQAPDVGLIADPGAAPVSIERVDDDYFLRIPGAPGKLLASGDRIGISPRCRLIFTQPNPSSTTAVLDLSAGRFPRADLRRVILLDRDLVIGPGSTAHIRSDQLTEPIVLNVRDGKLWCRNQTIAIGAPTVLNGLSLAVTV
jgi:hypothetical protein